MSKRIAWIEDDAELIYSVVRPLEKRGFKIDIFRTTQTAIENIDLIKQSSLILLDLMLPRGKHEDECDQVGYEGVKLLNKLRNTFLLNIPVIILSTFTEEKLFAQIAKNLNVAGIVSKPCRPSQLESVVLACIGNIETDVPSNEGLTIIDDGLRPDERENSFMKILHYVNDGFSLGVNEYLKRLEKISTFNRTYTVRELTHLARISRSSLMKWERDGATPLGISFDKPFINNEGERIYTDSHIKAIIKFLRSKGENMGKM